MSGAEIGFLVLVFAVFAGFAGVLGWGQHLTRDK